MSRPAGINMSCVLEYNVIAKEVLLRVLLLFPCASLLTTLPLPQVATQVGGVVINDLWESVEAFCRTFPQAPATSGYGGAPASFSHVLTCSAVASLTLRVTVGNYTSCAVQTTVSEAAANHGASRRAGPSRARRSPDPLLTHGRAGFTLLQQEAGAVRPAVHGHLRRRRRAEAAAQ